MKSMFRAMTLLILAVGLCLAPAARADDVQGGLELLAKGDALADEGKYDEAVLTYMKGFELLLPGMRGLPFKHSVEGRLMPREELRQELLKMVDEEMTPEEIRGDELLLKALGLAPDDFNLKDTMVAMLTEEIAAYYDPETKSMHLIHEPLPAGPRKEPGFFAKLMGAEPAFDKEETRGVLAHELAHALADQHYDLEKLDEAAKDDSDRAIALHALVEGEAMLAMIGATAEDWDGTMMPQMPAETFERMLAMMGPMMAVSGGKTFREAPPILRESLMFPYLQGLVFCARVANARGWEGLDRAYRNPPLSTEQVLHPEKYVAGLGKWDGPQRIELGKLEVQGWEEAARDMMGEMGIEVMLRKQRGKAAAAGWDGDACAVLESEDGRLGLVWMTTWDSAEDAREFAQAYARYQGLRFGLVKPEMPLELGQSPPKASADADHFRSGGDQSLKRTAGEKVLVIELRGSDVAIVEGFDEANTEALLKTALSAKKTEAKPPAE